MRLFVALDIDDAICERLARFVDGVRGFAPDARWVSAESLHVTLKFIGEKPENVVEDVKQALETVQAGSIEISFRGYGFFPSAKAPRVFWVAIAAPPSLAALASSINESMSPLGIPKEEHAYSPHLTLARGAGGSGSPHRRKGDKPNHSFHRLQEKLAALPAPEFGTMTARGFFLYRSQLSPKGAKYTKLARFPLA